MSKSKLKRQHQSPYSGYNESPYAGKAGKNPRSLDIVLLIEVLSTLSAWGAVRCKCTVEVRCHAASTRLQAHMPIVGK